MFSIRLNVDPGSNCEIPENITTGDLEVSYKPSSSGTYFYVGGTEPLNDLEVYGGNISVVGDVGNLKIGSELLNYYENRAGKIEITGDVEDATWYKKTAVIPETEFVPGYGEEEMNASISHCERISYFSGDFLMNGTLKKLNVKELYYRAEYHKDYLVIKNVINNYKTATELSPVIKAGELEKTLPTEYLTTYTTNQWMNNSKTYDFQVYYDENGYSWDQTTFLGGDYFSAAKDVALGEDGFPLNVDLNKATITVHGTNTTGLVFPDQVNLNRLSVESGKVVVNGNVIFATIEDTSRSSSNDDAVNVTIKGNVRTLYISKYTVNTNIIVEGDITEGIFELGYEYKDNWIVCANFSKSLDDSSEVLIDGMVNSKYILYYDDGKGPVGFYMNMSLTDFEAAVGIKEDNREKMFGEEKAYATGAVTIYLKTLDEAMIQTIADKIILKDGYHVTKQAFNINVGTYYVGEVRQYAGEELTSTLEEIPFSIVIPDYDKDAKYGIVRVHDNGDGTTSYDVLPTSVLNGVISFASNKFSDFVIIKGDVQEQKAITASMISEIPTVEFNGEHFCPVPVVKDGAITLKEGTDYTLTYTNNRNSGVASVNVVGKGNYVGTIQTPFRILEKKSKVKIKDKETPRVIATNLNKLYEDEAIYTPEDRQIEENGGSVNIELSVQTQVVSVADQTKIKKMAKNKEIGLFLDISLYKTVQLAGAANESTSQINHTNQLLSIVIPIPDELKGRKGIELYRVHNGVPSVIPVGAENAIDGEYCTTDSKNITLYVQNFSTYAIGYSVSDIKSPQTGEESSQLPWILLGLGLGFVGVVVVKKSRCKLSTNK